MYCIHVYDVYVYICTVHIVFTHITEYMRTVYSTHELYTRIRRICVHLYCTYCIYTHQPRNSLHGNIHLYVYRCKYAIVHTCLVIHVRPRGLHVVCKYVCVLCVMKCTVIIWSLFKSKLSRFSRDMTSRNIMLYITM